MTDPGQPERILIYRLGSIGDTIVALPCFHLLARCYPHAERRVLTNRPVEGRAAPLEAVLAGSGLIHGTFEYSLGERRVGPLLTLYRSMRRWKPDLLVYLAPPRGPRAIRRDLLFFRACRIPRIIGAPTAPDLAAHRSIPGHDRWETEAERLARCLEPLGDARVADAASWDLCLTREEKRAARQHLDNLGSGGSFIVLSIGAKVDVKDWGDANWRVVLEAVSSRASSLGLVLIGAAEERQRSDRLAKSWSGPVLNLCGSTTPRQSAAVIAQARLFIGHDSGPMHLADAVGTQCIAIFSARNRPGVWFPHGAGHVVFYERTPCFDCELSVCTEYDKMCIRAISPDSVVEASLAALGAKHGYARNG